MKVVIGGIAVMVVLAGGFGAVHALPHMQGLATRSTLAPAADDAPHQAPAIPGCDATWSADLRHLLRNPSVAGYGARLWRNARRTILADDGPGPDALADLERIGIRSLSDLHSLTVCTTAEPGQPNRRRLDTLSHGFLIRGAFADGLVQPLVIKWSRSMHSEVDALWQYKGNQVVRLADGTLLAQRADRSVVIASDAHTLTLLLDAPSAPHPSALALTLHVSNVARLLRERTARDAVLVDSTQSVDIQVLPTFERARVTLRTSDQRATDDLYSWVQSCVTEAVEEFPFLRKRNLERLAAEAIVGATITQQPRSITLELSLPQTASELVLNKVLGKP